MNENPVSWTCLGVRINARCAARGGQLANVLALILRYTPTVEIGIKKRVLLICHINYCVHGPTHSPLNGVKAIIVLN